MYNLLDENREKNINFFCQLPGILQDLFLNMRRQSVSGGVMQRQSPTLPGVARSTVSREMGNFLVHFSTTRLLKILYIC